MYRTESKKRVRKRSGLFQKRILILFSMTLIFSPFIAAFGSSVAYALRNMDIVNVTNPADIEVAYGTSLEDVPFPDTVFGTLKDPDGIETNTELDVKWGGSHFDYDGHRPGTYIFTGELSSFLPISNPDEILAEITVIVLDEVTEPEEPGDGDVEEPSEPTNPEEPGDGDVEEPTEPTNPEEPGMVM